MDIKDVRGKGDAELAGELRDQRETLRRARFELAAGREKDVRAVRKVRRAIARMLTVLAERHRSA